MSDIQLVNNIKNNIDIENNITSLLNLHNALITSISSKYTKLLHDSGSSIEELNQERPFLIYKAAITYKDNRNTKFSTYLASYTKWYCLNKINKSTNWKHMGEESLDNISAEEEKDETALEYVKHLLSQIEDKKIAKVIKLRYFSGSKVMSFCKIGEALGVSGQCANNWMQKGIKLLNARVTSQNECKYD